MTDPDAQDCPGIASSISEDIPVSGNTGNREPGTRVTLEGIVTLTEEMEHLNELVLHHIRISGGFTGAAAYFALVNPILDRLEAEIRLRSHDGISKDELKIIIAGWIDGEIAGLRISSPAGPTPGTDIKKEDSE